VTSIDTVKIYGERNTGTSYLERLLALHFDVRFLRGAAPRWAYSDRFASEATRDLYFRVTFGANLGWKHMLVPEVLPLRPGTLVLCLTKNPYAWLRSMYRRPFHAKRAFKDFDDFLRGPWPTVGRDRGPASYSDPVRLWNAKHAAYVRARQRYGAVILAYEELLRDPEHALAALGSEHGLLRLTRTFRNIEGATHSDTPERDNRFLREYFADEGWRREFTKEQLQFIAESLDGDVMAALGYRALPVS